MKTRFGFETLLMNQDPGSALAGGGGEPAPAADPAPGGEPIPNGGDPAPIDSIYGELQVKFPEGFDATLKEEPSLKGFVDKESGEINYSNLMKSYVHGQKQMGTNKTVLPTDASTPEELDAFYEKLGYKPDEADYVLNKGEESKLSDERVTAIKAFARENRLPLAVAQKLVAQEEASALESINSNTQAVAAQIEEGLEGLKAEWGQAYAPKLAMASKVLAEVVNDEAITAVFADPRIGSNPAVIKALNAIGQKLFKEDGFAGEANDGAMSPAEADTAINEIMGDKASPYWNKSHNSHADMVKKVGDLYKMKEGR